MNQIERRFVPQTEMRFVSDGDKRKVAGYAAVFGKWSEDLGGFREMIRPGAFSKTIKEADVRALFNHDPNFPLGRSTNGSLRLFEDDNGLGYELDLPDTSYARDLAVSIERGDISQNSFGFSTVRDQWDKAYSKRELIEVQLFDISPVTFPAYPQTELSLRESLIHVIESVKQPELRKFRAADRELIREAVELLRSIEDIAPREPHPMPEKEEPVKPTTRSEKDIRELSEYVQKMKEYYR